MPLYNKAKNFDEEELENMSFDECYELLLIFRYLQFREDETIDKELIKVRMEQLRKRMLELNENSTHFKNFL
ncbi:hypothetical protein AAE02nite_39420 [Adhaeribacter aerolatus]|uniref:Uncharacterized protein n=1 Tax=Adhaeribacter aerolatus TaxID=670289 RepID=A0A512B2T4_9BACT|nr:hypothetical protein [Adhaeribacter aerolatus]GEO06278.1 hypothetical protein AAE02nite_39420 [Adhaeribacter aerolatus]